MPLEVRIREIQDPRLVHPPGTGEVVGVGQANVRPLVVGEIQVVTAQGIVVHPLGDANE